MAYLLIPALKSELFPAEDRQPKTRFSADLRRFAATAAAKPLADFHAEICTYEME
jgi:hypothetical protein